MFQDNYCGVYAITCLASGKRYVGSSQNMVSRQARHLKDLRDGRHHNRHLQNAFNLDGEANLIFSVLQVCHDRTAAYRLEAEILSSGEDLLNIGTGVRGGDNLTRNPERARIVKSIREGSAAAVAQLSQKQRQVRYGRPGESNGMYGQSHSPVARQILSRFHTGNKYASGSVRSDAHRATLSAFASQRTGEKNPFYGQKHTAETKEKIAATKARQPRVLPSNSLRLTIDGVLYLCVKDAVKATGLSRFVIKRRLADPAYETYQEIE